jgi:hypothetical protein
MTSVEAGEPGVAVVNEYSHFQAFILPRGSPASCSGSTTRILIGSAAFWPPLLTPEPPAKKQWADARGTGCRGWPSAWPARWPRLASRTRWLPTSRGPLPPRNRVPGRCDRHPDRDPGDPRLILGRRDRPHSPPRGARTGLLVGCLLAADDAAPHQLAVARSCTTSTSTPRLSPPSAGQGSSSRS